MNKKTIRTALIGCIIALFLGVSFTQLVLIGNLSEQIKSLEARINNLANELPYVYPATSTIVNNQEYLLESWEDEYINLDTKKHTVDYYLKVMPKTITDNMKVSLLYKDNTYEMTPNGNYYEVTIPLPLFDVSNDSSQTYIIIEKDGEKKFQSYSNMYTDSLYYQFLPTLQINQDRTSCTTIGKELTINYDYKIGIEKLGFDNSKVANFIKIELVTNSNGKEIERVDITKKVKEANKNVSVFGGGNKGKKTFKDFDGSDYVHMYFEAVDEYGYIHKHTLTYDSADNNYDSERYFYNIYDKDGNKLIKYE